MNGKSVFFRSSQAARHRIHSPPYPLNPSVTCL
nr:MAG TPA: hypothetical protein [Caudoviricetes sp.]